MINKSGHEGNAPKYDQCKLKNFNTIHNRGIRNGKKYQHD